jgi:hydrogenase maturation factor
VLSTVTFFVAGFEPVGLFMQIEFVVLFVTRGAARVRQFDKSRPRHATWRGCVALARLVKSKVR